MKNENIVIFVISESGQDYLDYVQQLNTECECVNASTVASKNINQLIFDYSMHPVELHMTKFATRWREPKIMFMDLLLGLGMHKNISSVIETETGCIKNEIEFIHT